MTTKILIYVEAGTVQAVTSNKEDTQIVIIDMDNNRDSKNGFISEILCPEAIFENLYEGFTDETDPDCMEIRDELKRMKF